MGGNKSRGRGRGRLLIPALGQEGVTPRGTPKHEACPRPTPHPRVPEGCGAGGCGRGAKATRPVTPGPAKPLPGRRALSTRTAEAGRALGSDGSRAQPKHTGAGPLVGAEPPIPHPHPTPQPRPEAGTGPGQVTLPCPQEPSGSAPGRQRARPWTGPSVLTAFQESREGGGGASPA